MMDVMTKDQRSYCMSKIKGKDTKPEVSLKKHLWSLGIRGYRVNTNTYGKPDVIFKKKKIAIFVDGCFWHKCPKHYVEPKSNKSFWLPKIEKNVKRDKEVTRRLQKEGWTVIRFWEHDVKDDIEMCTKKIKKVLDADKTNKGKHTEKKLNMIDLFCGAGGLSEGFMQAGFNVLLGIDSDYKFIETFKKNHPDSIALCKDVRKISAKKIKQIIGKRKIHVVAGGPPCQSFSIAGRREPNDPRDSLFMEFVRIVNEIQPNYFVMENVNGIKSKKLKNGKRAMSVILEEFKQIGYKVKYKTLNSADYGVPQKRRRVILIGSRKDSDMPFPPKTHSQKPYMKIEGMMVNKWVPVKDVLLGKDEAPKNYFHTQRMIDGFINRRKKNIERGYGFGWQILDPDKPSYTISARYWKDGSDALVKYSEDEVRMLTERECARIQSFPENYKFVGNKRDVYTQIGNAVPVLMAKAIAEEIKKELY